MSEPNPRIVSLDVLRGFALLGILLMNIQSFTMPGVAYLNPTAFGDLAGLNRAVWLACHVLVDLKFLEIFSILFGVGVCLFCDGLEQRGQKVAPTHFRRMGWLMVFGLLHGYLLWYGDILFAYSLCGMLIYGFRKRGVPTLLITAAVFLSIPSILSIIVGQALPQLPADAVDALRMEWRPTTEVLDQEVTALTGSLVDQFTFRASATFTMQTTFVATFALWRASAMMLVGMALFRMGFFHLQWPAVAYVQVAIVGGVLGLPPILIGVQENFAAGFSMEYSMFIGSQWNYWGSVPLALAYTSLVMLVVKQSRLPGLSQRLAAVGRLAFSNYIMHSVIALLIFNLGGLFGAVDRTQQILFVLAIWAFQLWLSAWYCQRYRQGPLEALWRRLTYGARPV